MLRAKLRSGVSIGDIILNRNFIGCGVRADRVGGLEQGTDLIPRRRLAGPAKFAQAFCREAKCRVPSFGGWMLRTFGHGPTLNRPSRPIVRPPLQNSHLPGRSGKRGCEGRLRASMCSKLLRIPPPQAGSSFFDGKMHARSSTGQPAVFAAPSPSPIRANALDRHGNHNRYKSSSGPIAKGCYVPRLNTQKMDWRLSHSLARVESMRFAKRVRV
jgi:hypothetical protein